MKDSGKAVSPMSNEGRNAYVIRQLTQSLVALLEENPLEEISVSQLCSRAQVGRASFYRNFESLEEVLVAYIQSLFFQWQEGYDMRLRHSVPELLKVLFTHFEAHREFYSLLNDRQLIYLLKELILDFCGPKPEYPKEYAYAVACAAYTLYGWIEVWFRRGMQESAMEIVELFKRRGM